MSRFMKTMTGITLATLAVHFFTGQGKVTAVILIADAVLLIGAVADYFRKKGKA